MREEIFEGKSEEEALLKASQTLQVNISDMEYEVTERDTGLFGLFGKSVTVKVRVKDGANVIRHRDGEGVAIETLAGLDDDSPATEPDDDWGNRITTGPTVTKGPQARQALLDVLQHMDVEAEVTVQEDDESVSLEIIGADSELVVGRDGEILSSLQFLVNRMVNRSSDERKLVVVDADGFRDKRMASLGEMAREMGEKAVSSGKIVRLGPLNAQDRRLVHLALKGHDKLTTRSEGEGHFKRLLIIPNNYRENRGDRSGRSADRGRSNGRARRDAPAPQPDTKQRGEGER